MIRKARIEEAAAIATLHMRSWQRVYARELPASYLHNLDLVERTRDWRNALLDPRMAVKVYDDGMIRGFCASRHARDEHEITTTEIANLHVDPDVRGRGIGSALFDDATAEARKAGATSVWLWVVVTNEPARRFYEHKGMRATDRHQEHPLAPGVVLHEIAYQLGLSVGV